MICLSTLWNVWFRRYAYLCVHTTVYMRPAYWPLLVFLTVSRSASIVKTLHILSGCNTLPETWIVVAKVYTFLDSIWIVCIFLITLCVNTILSIDKTPQNKPCWLQNIVMYVYTFWTYLIKGVTLALQDWFPKPPPSHGETKICKQLQHCELSCCCTELIVQVMQRFGTCLVSFEVYITCIKTALCSTFDSTTGHCVYKPTLFIAYSSHTDVGSCAI